MLLCSCALVLLAGSCRQQGSTAITLAGSTSVEPFAERLAELYMRKHKGIEINVQGGGSSAGIRAVQSGICQIGMSSRALNPEEKGLYEIPIALDGIVLVVNRQNPILELTLKQVQAIFSGKTKVWTGWEGPRRRITVITREDGSGTRASFEERAMAGTTFAPDALVQDSNGAVREIVAGDPAAIGYISFGLVDNRVHALALNGVAPSESSISSGAYPVVRKFLFLTKSEPSGTTRQFVDYVLSDEGQQALVDEGLVGIENNSE